MKVRVVAVLGILSLLLAAGCANSPEKMPPKEEKPAVTQPEDPTIGLRETLTATATVKAINPQTRVVTLKTSDGKTFDLKVGDAVRNLDQVKVGDKVVVTYYSALLLQLATKKGNGITVRTDTLSAGRAEPGQMPAGVVSDTVKVTANILSVNKKARRVLVKGPHRAVTLTVPADMDMNKFKVGDQVDAEYVQALAINVEPAPAKPHKKGAGYEKKQM